MLRHGYEIYFLFGRIKFYKQVSGYNDIMMKKMDEREMYVTYKEEENQLVTTCTKKQVSHWECHRGKRRG